MPARLRTIVAALLSLLPSALSAQGAGSADLSRDLERLRKGEKISGLPPASAVAPGARTIPAGIVVKETVVARGPVDVYGQVDGTVVSLTGDVTVHAGGLVSGDAISVGGRVTADSGRVLGELRSMSSLPSLLGAPAVVADARTSAQRTMDAAKIVSGTFAILLVIALAVLLFAGPNLDEVAATIESQFVRAFWYGVLGQLVALPGLLVVIVALALSIIGILLIPFGIVAYAIAAAGLAMLGFLAVTRLIGGALWRDASATVRARTLRALAVGLAIFFTLWMVAALFTWAPMASTIIRAAALAATWAALTLGLGAAILSRAGTHRRVAGATAGRPVELASWQTPTPVAGVVAARRTVSAGRDGR